MPQARAVPTELSIEGEVKKNISPSAGFFILFHLGMVFICR
jgi:hypothetical protein